MLPWARGRFLLLACLALGACATRPGHYYQDDGPPENAPAGLAQTPDAVPRVEALNLRANRPYSALGRSYTPDVSDAPFEQRGVASWYGRQYHGKPTASGEPYDMYAMTAAHPTLPIPSYARVSRPDDGRSVIVRINDRGPFLQDRIIDLSYAAATRLGIVGPGSGEVSVRKITAHDIAAGTYGPAAAPMAASNVPAAAAPVADAPGLPTEAAIGSRVVASASPGSTAPASATPAIAAPLGPVAVAPVTAGIAVPIAPLAAPPLAPQTQKPTEPTALASPPRAAATPSADGGAAPATSAPPDAAPAVAAPAAAVAAVVAAAPAAAPGQSPPPAATPAISDTPAAAAADVAVSKGKWSVQLGAFAVLANAEALRDQLTSLLASPEAEVLPAGSRHPRIESDGHLHHVLVGAFDARADAQRGARALQRYLSRETTIYRP